MTQALPTCHPRGGHTPVTWYPLGLEAHPGPCRLLPTLDLETPLVLHDNYTDKEAGVEEINQWHHMDFLGMGLWNGFCAFSHLESH